MLEIRIRELFKTRRRDGVEGLGYLSTESRSAVLRCSFKIPVLTG